MSSGSKSRRSAWKRIPGSRNARHSCHHNRNTSAVRRTDGGQSREDSLKARNVRDWLHLTIGLLVSVIALWLFAGITEDVINHGSITELDLTVLQWLQARHTLLGIRIFWAVTLLGSPVFIAVLGVVVARVLARRQQSLVMAGWSVALVGSALLERVLKLSIRRPRPDFAAQFLYDSSYSFPSGHAMNSLVAYGMLAYILVTCWARHRAAQIAIIVCAALLILAIGFSRLYLGVHYLSDVAAGFAAGIFWLSICITGVEVGRASARRSAYRKP